MAPSWVLISTTSDLTSYNLSDYNYKLLKENDKVDGSDAWVIYSEPKNDDVKEETGYAKKRDLGTQGQLRGRACQELGSQES